MTEPQPPPPEPPTPRKRPPTWGIVLFLILLGGLLMLNQVISTSGPAIQWIENDLDAALARAVEQKTYVFLYIYDPNDPTHARNELEVFDQRWAREPLANVVCCRVSLAQDRLVGVKYRYEGTPRFLMLSRSGQLLEAIDGVAVDKRQFRTHIGEIAKRPQ